MCHFLAPAGQPEMMHENFMHGQKESQEKRGYTAFWAAFT